MFHWVLMHVIKSSQVRLWVRQLCIPKVVPNIASRNIIKCIQFARSLAMQVIQKQLEILCLSITSGDNVVVIRESRPCLKLPEILFGQREQTSFEYIEPITTAEKTLVV